MQLGPTISILVDQPLVLSLILVAAQSAGLQSDSQSSPYQAVKQNIWRKPSPQKRQFGYDNSSVNSLQATNRRTQRLSTQTTKAPLPSQKTLNSTREPSTSISATIS